jgi:hypothetical protein
MLLAPRGHLKTTLAGGLVLHFFIQPQGSNIYFPQEIGELGHNDGRSTRVLMASKSMQHAADRLSFIKLKLESNPLFHAFWPDVFWEQPEKQSRIWNKEEILLKRSDIFVEPSIKTIGVGGQIVGYHFNVQTYDDIIDDKDRYSPTTMKTAFDWLVASRMLMDNINKSLEIITGTHWANNDVYTLIRENDTSVETRVYSALTQGSVEMKNGEPFFSEDARALWPQVFPIPTLQMLAHPAPYGVGDLFPLCYLNDPYHSSVVDFDPSHLRYYRIEGNQITFDQDERDEVLKRILAPQQWPSFLQQGQQSPYYGQPFNGQGYEVMREQLRDRSSKIYFNGR